MPNRAKAISQASLSGRGRRIASRAITAMQAKLTMAEMMGKMTTICRDSGSIRLGNGEERVVPARFYTEPTCPLGLSGQVSVHRITTSLSRDPAHDPVEGDAEKD